MSTIDSTMYNYYRMLKFHESQYSRPKYIDTLESSGLQGDMLLVEGIRTGSANVKAILKDPAYKVLLKESKATLLSL